MNEKAFTLVEALVALTILTVGLVPAFQQASLAVSFSGSIRNLLTASSLAQEGVEVVRAIRDNNWFAGQPFDTGLTGGAASCDSSGCRIQYDSTSPLPLDVNPPLKVDQLSGTYQYDSGTASGFQRKIMTKKISPHELEVISEVDWTEKSGPKNVSVEYHLYDWLQ